MVPGCYHRSWKVHAEPESEGWGLIRWTTTCQGIRDHWWNYAACWEAQEVSAQHHQDHTSSFHHTEVRACECVSTGLNISHITPTYLIVPTFHACTILSVTVSLSVVSLCNLIILFLICLEWTLTLWTMMTLVWLCAIWPPWGRSPRVSIFI